MGRLCFGPGTSEPGSIFFLKLGSVSVRCYGIAKFL